MSGNLLAARRYHQIYEQNFPAFAMHRTCQLESLYLIFIEDLLSGKTKPNYPDLSRGGLNFKKARIEEQRVAQKKLDGF